MGRIRRVIKEAFPDWGPVFGGHGIGGRAPRVRTISFRLRDEFGKFRSNVVWLMPECLSSLTASNIQYLVAQANGKHK